jgi:hypothetical protein
MRHLLLIRRTLPMTAALTTAALVALLLSGCDALPRLNPNPAAQAEAAAPAPARAADNSGRIEIVQWPIVRIDRKEMRAAPGARIIGNGNLSVTPNQIPPNARVSYELDGMGQIRILRILPAEAAGDRVGPPDTPRTGPQ